MNRLKKTNTMAVQFKNFVECVIVCLPYVFTQIIILMFLGNTISIALI